MGGKKLKHNVSVSFYIIFLESFHFKVMYVLYMIHDI